MFTLGIVTTFVFLGFLTEPTPPIPYTGPSTFASKTECNQAAEKYAQQTVAHLKNQLQLHGGSAFFTLRLECKQVGEDV